MNVIIDNFVSLSGWTSTGTMSADILNEHPDFIAGGLSTSVIFEIPSGNLDESITKTINFDFTEYTEIVFSIWSRNKKYDNFNKITDYQYKINFGGDDYYIPTTRNFSQVVIGVSDTTLTKIEITALHDDEDYIVMSHMLAVKEELPLDLFGAVKTKLLSDIALDNEMIIPVGNLTGSASDDNIELTGVDNNYFVEKYMVIKISDGVNTEYHQIGEIDGFNCKLTSLYDGKRLLYDHINKSCYIYFAVEYGNQREIILPGISVWGMTPEIIYRGAALDKVVDTVKTLGLVSSRQEGHIQKFNILLDCESTSYELVNAMAKICRKFIAREIIWINGFPFDVVSDGIPVEIAPTEDTDFIPKIQYSFNIEYKENLYNRAILSPVSTTNLEVDVL